MRRFLMVGLFVGTLLGRSAVAADRPEDRRALHYWDGCDFRDSSWVATPGASMDSVKARLVEYLRLLPGVDSIACGQSVKAFVEKAYRYPALRLYFTDEVEYALFNPASPLQDDRLYMAFLRETLASKWLKDEEKTRYRFQLENVAKNLPGSRATDFAYLDKKGTRRRMYDVQAGYLVLFFYNPDCGRCRQAGDYLRKEPVLQHDGVKVLAVYPGALTREWQDYPSPFPPAWIDGCSPDGEINNRLLYFIQGTPSVYLLDKDKRVILKNSPVDKLIGYLKDRVCNVYRENKQNGAEEKNVNRSLSAFQRMN